MVCRLLEPRIDAARPSPVCTCRLLCVLLAASVACAVGHAENAGADSLSGFFDVSAVIPGTREYRLQKASEDLSTLLGDLDAVEDARVVLKGSGGERIRALITLGLASPDSWDREFSGALITLVRGCEPSLDSRSLQIVDRDGRVLYTDGHPVSVNAPVGTTPRPGRNVPEGVVVFTAVGVIAGLLAAGVWWFRAKRRSRPPDRDATHNPWRFLTEADSDTIARAFSDLRMEMAGAIIAELDDVTREHVLRSLPADGRPAVEPSEQMHPDIQTVLQRLLHRRCKI
ncbi:MAG: hypothetical protein R6V19_17345 [Armatimonadota bacterium]